MWDSHQIQNSKLLQVPYNYCIYKQSLARCYIIIKTSLDCISYKENSAGLC